MKQPKPDISFIIPVYNTAAYVEQCLDSVVAINKIATEIIVVNDGSTDSSLSLIKQKYGTDKRLKIIALKENGGLSNAKNQGIKRASGGYLGFIDSDDYVEPKIVEHIFMKYALQKRKPDIIANRFTLFENGKQPRQIKLTTHDKTCEETCTGKAYFIERINHKSLRYATQHYFFRRELLTDNQLFFDIALKYAEDVEFIPRALYFAQEIVETNQAFYYYRRNRIGNKSLDLENHSVGYQRTVENFSAFASTIKDKAFIRNLRYLATLLAGTVILLAPNTNHSSVGWAKSLIKINPKWSIRLIFFYAFLKHFPKCSILLKKRKDWLKQYLIK